MPDKVSLTQQFIRFDTPFDFNSLALMLSSYNFASKIHVFDFDYILRHY